MGICVSKRDLYRNERLYRDEDMADSRYSAGGESAQVSTVEADETSNYSLRFDEWGATVLEPESVRWHVVSLPTTKMCTGPPDLHGESSKVSQTYTAALFEEEFNGNPCMPSAPLAEKLTSEPRATGFVSNIVHEHASESDQLDVSMAQAPIVAMAESNRSNSLRKQVRRRGLGSNWNPLLEIHSARPPLDGHNRSVILSAEVSSTPRAAHVYSHTLGADFIARPRSDQQMRGTRDNCSQSHSIDLMRPLANKAGGEIGVFDAEKYFTDGERDIADADCAGAFEGPSSCPSEVQDTGSFHYRISAAASSDVSYDSKSAISGAKKMASDAVWNASKRKGSRKMNKVSRRSIVGRVVVSKWSVCGGLKAVEAEEGELDDLGGKRRHDTSSLSVERFPKLEAAPENAISSTPRLNKELTSIGKQEQPVSQSTKLGNLLISNTRRSCSKSENDLLSIFKQDHEPASPSAKLANLLSKSSRRPEAGSMSKESRSQGTFKGKVSTRTSAKVASRIMDDTMFTKCSMKSDMLGSKDRAINQGCVCEGVCQFSTPKPQYAEEEQGLETTKMQQANQRTEDDGGCTMLYESVLDYERDSFSFPNLGWLPPAVVPLEDTVVSSGGSTPPQTDGSCGGGGGAGGGSAFGSPFSVSCPSIDRRTAASLLESDQLMRRLHLYCQRARGTGSDDSDSSSDLFDLDRDSLSVYRSKSKN